jgi:hypothetical protein
VWLWGTSSLGSVDRVLRSGARPRRLAVLVLLIGVPTLVAGCSSGSDGGAPPQTGGGTGSTLERPAVPDVPGESRPGTGVIVVGGTTSSFAVTECQLEPDPAAPTGARALVALKGAGTTGSGVAFTVELQRFATGTGVVTYTDTVSYADAGRILQAQRIEVNGQVTDLRDPKAATPLVRTRSGGVTARGLASAPGDGPDDGGLIGLALDATC